MSQLDDSLAQAFAAVGSSYALERNPYVVTMNVAVATDFHAPSLTTLRESMASAASAIASRPFRNCIIVKMDPAVYGCNATCKVFVNGSMQISGCKTLEAVAEVAEDMTLALHLFFKTAAAILSYKVQMINTSLFLILS